MVDSTSYLIPKQAQVAESEAITPIMVATFIAIIIIGVSIIEWRKKKNFWGLMPSCSS